MNVKCVQSQIYSGGRARIQAHAVSTQTSRLPPSPTLPASPGKELVVHSECISRMFQDIISYMGSAQLSKSFVLTAELILNDVQEGQSGRQRLRGC